MHSFLLLLSLLVTNEFHLVLTANEINKLQVNVTPQCPVTTDNHGSNSPDCGPVIRAAIATCKQRQKQRQLKSRSSEFQECKVTLQPGVYRVACPMGGGEIIDNNGSSAAVDLSNASLITFGGLNETNPAIIEVDYVNGGCPGIVAAHANNITIENIILDTARLPFTYGTITSVLFNTDEVVIATDEPSHLYWNTTRYSWLNNFFSEGALGGFSSSVWSNETGSITLKYNVSNPQRLNYKKGDKVLIKHFINMRSWGVYGWMVSGHFTLENVKLLSCAGMGLRCDFCVGNFNIFNSAVTAGPGRSMSSTADGIHAMHHTGNLVLRNTLVSNTGDDCFNVHGNFIILSDISNDRMSATYIDETGPGWITGAPTYLVGDTVKFFSRLSLQQIGLTNTLTGATGGFGANATVSFSQPIPEEVKRYDMFLSYSRISSLDVEQCTFRPGGRGLVISAENVRIVNNSFEDLQHSNVLFLNGGCGAYEDYTEGPFSTNIIIEQNTFTNNFGSIAEPTQGKAVIELTGCRPMGECKVSEPNNAYGPTPRDIPYLVPENYSKILRIVNVSLSSYQNITHLGYFHNCTESELSPLQGVIMGLYSKSSKKLLGTADQYDSCDKGWRISPLTRTGAQGNETEYILAHWYSSGEWDTIQSEGYHQFVPYNSNNSLPNSLSAMNFSIYPKSGVPLILITDGDVGNTNSYFYPDCEAGGSTVPPVIPHEGDSGPGRITEPGIPVVGSTIYSNLSIVNNFFNGTYTHAILVGATAGINIDNNNVYMSSKTNTSFSIYSSIGYSISAIDEGNMCFHDNTKTPCLTGNSSLKEIN
eukprot:m.22807 g.22807  ORF g.22807 m.22807 type:complete len:817 (-) comp7442_c0_seq1:1203-3653(-)